MFFRKGQGRRQLVLATALLSLLLAQVLCNVIAVFAAPMRSVSSAPIDRYNTDETGLVHWQRRLALDFGKEKKRERKADDDYWNTKEERVSASTSLRFPPPPQQVVEKGLTRSQSLQKDPHAVLPSSSPLTFRSILRKLSLKKSTSRKQAKGEKSKVSLEGQDLDKPLLQSFEQEDKSQRYDQLPDPHFHHDNLPPTLHELLVIERKSQAMRRMLGGPARATATPSQVPYRFQILCEADDSEPTRV